MKKLSILTATVLATGVLFSGPALAVDLGQASATITSAIGVTQPVALNFGLIIPAAAASIVVIDPATNYRTSETATLVGAGFSRGVFNVTGSNALPFTVTRAATATLTNGTSAQDMTVTLSGATTGTLSGGYATFFVGGSLAVGALASQPAGQYTGTYSLTVAYD
jgi:hypothetical protein